MLALVDEVPEVPEVPVDEVPVLALGEGDNCETVGLGEEHLLKD